MDRLDRFSAIFQKGDNFCDFLFAFMYTYPFWKVLYSKRKGEQILSF